MPWVRGEVAAVSGSALTPRLRNKLLLLRKAARWRAGRRRSPACCCGADAVLRVALRLEVRTSNAFGYREVTTQSPCGINGGGWPSPPEGHHLVQLFVEVDDVDA